MRKLIIVGVICVSLLFLLSVYAIPPASSTWTVRLSATHGLAAGDVVEEAGRRIGEVVSVESRVDAAGNPGTDVLITLDPSARDRVRERSTFLVTTPAGSTRPALSLVVFDEHSPVLPPGSQITGAESEMELEVRRQVAGLESAMRGISQQLDQLRQVLDKTSKSEEKRKLEESVSRFFATVQRTRDDIVRVVTEEAARWKKLYDKLFPPERERTV